MYPTIGRIGKRVDGHYRCSAGSTFTPTHSESVWIDRRSQRMQEDQIDNEKLFQI